MGWLARVAEGVTPDGAGDADKDGETEGSSDADGAGDRLREAVTGTLWHGARSKGCTSTSPSPCRPSRFLDTGITNIDTYHRYEVICSAGPTCLKHSGGLHPWAPDAQTPVQYPLGPTVRCLKNGLCYCPATTPIGSPLFHLPHVEHCRTQIRLHLRAYWFLLWAMGL